MTNKQYIIFALVSILLLMGVFFVWIVSDFSNNNSLPAASTGDNSQSDDLNLKTDPLITPTKELYGSLINENDPVRGSGAAGLVILEFGDFECPYCQTIFPDLVKILSEYQGKVKLIWKDFPNPSHLNARDAALAARCAGGQGQFWEYHDYLFANQAELSREMYNQIALELELDLSQFNKCLDGQEKIELIGQGLEDGQKLGVDATPYIFIGNKQFNYALTYEELKRAVEEEIRK